MSRLNQERQNPANRHRQYFFTADDTFAEFEHEGISYKKFVFGRKNCDRARIFVYGQAEKGRSVRENAAMKILPLLDNFFSNEVPFRDSLPEHVMSALAHSKRKAPQDSGAEPGPVVKGPLQCPLCKRLCELNNNKTSGHHTYSELVDHIWVHIGGHSLLCNLCGSTHRISLERVPNDTIQAMKHLKLKHRSIPSIQTLVTDWHPGNPLGSQHIKLIRKCFEDCGESCVEKLTRRIIMSIIKNDDYHLGHPLNYYNNPSSDFDWKVHRMFKCELQASEPMDTSESLFVPSVIIKNQYSGSPLTPLQSETLVDDDPIIIKDTNESRVPDPNINITPVKILAVIGALSFSEGDKLSLCGEEYLKDHMIYAYYQIIAEQASVKSHMFDPLQTHLLADQRQSVKFIQRFKNKFSSDCEVLFFPFCKSHHWFMIVVYVRDKNIAYFDSYAESDEHYKMCDYVRDFLCSAYASINAKKWHSDKIVNTRFPKQKDRVNCGIFMLAYIEKILNMKPDFSQVMNKEAIKTYRQFVWDTIVKSPKNTIKIAKEKNTQAQ
ncbi:unnamed protein product [Sphagnum jensenii]|uniref:Ubiquitin-like protease family profile domain-containing protein n=1 Tax=Sphagnum jensenii TaxID=128206 RepID=A0ABP0VG23_9BRYO